MWADVDRRWGDSGRRSKGRAGGATGRAEWWDADGIEYAGSYKYDENEMILSYLYGEMG